MSENSPSAKKKRWRKIVLWVLPLGAVYWAFSYYVFIPVCMDPSKPVTLYLESSKEQQQDGAVKRVTFRIPSAYLINPAYAPHLVGGIQNSLNLNVNVRNFNSDSEKHEPMCLSKISKYTDNRFLITVMVHGIMTKKSFSDFMASQLPESAELTNAENGFLAYKLKSSISEYVVPENNLGNPIYFDCISRNYEHYEENSSGCSAWTTYRGMGVEYIFRRSQLPQWQEIQKKTFSFIDSMITDIEQ